MVKISATLAKQLVKRHKYGAKRTICLYGHDHDSKKESMECIKLRELEKEGKILFLKRQPVFELKVNGVLVCRHRPDFSYYTPLMVENVYCFKQHILEAKGFQTVDWKIKHKLFCAIFPEIEYTVV